MILRVLEFRQCEDNKKWRYWTCRELVRSKLHEEIKHHYGVLPKQVGSVRREGVQTVLGHLKKQKSVKCVISKKVVDYAPGASYTPLNVKSGEKMREAMITARAAVENWWGDRSCGSTCE
jgi:hypothetical protein